MGKKGGKLKWIVIAVIIIGVAIPMMSGSENTSSTNTTGKKTGTIEESSNDSTSNSENDGDSEMSNVYRPKDVVEFGSFIISYHSAKEYTDYDEYSEPAPGYKYVQFEFTFKNKSDVDSMLGSFSCYANNQKCDQEYLLDTEEFWLDTLSGGREKTGSVSFSVPEDTKLKDIELEYENDDWFSDSKIIFKGK